MRSPTRPLRMIATAPKRGAAREQGADLGLRVAVVAEAQRQQHLHRAADHGDQGDDQQREPDQPLARDGANGGQEAALPLHQLAAARQEHRDHAERRDHRRGHQERRFDPGQRRAEAADQRPGDHAHRRRRVGDPDRPAAALDRRGLGEPGQAGAPGDRRGKALGEAAGEQRSVAGLERDHDGRGTHDQLAGDRNVAGADPVGQVAHRHGQQDHPEAVRREQQRGLRLRQPEVVGVGRKQRQNRRPERQIDRHHEGHQDGHLAHRVILLGASVPPFQRPWPVPPARRPPCRLSSDRRSQSGIGVTTIDRWSPRVIANAI